MELLLLAALISQALAAPAALTRRAAVRPQLKQATYLANVTDPSLSRDSCGSTQIGARTFWTCRDTMLYNASTNQCTFPIITNSASWTNMSSSGGPAIQQNGPVGAGSSGSNAILQMYGGDTSASSMTPYYAVQSDACPTNGVCADGSRWPVWPNQPPVITSSDSSDGTAVGYTWIAKAHIANLTALNPQPAYSLYKTFFPSGGTDSNTLPYATLVDAAFWPAGQIGYGNYGSLLQNDTLYLYGQTNTAQTALARVPLASVEETSAYEYYVNGTWTPTAPPALNSTTTTTSTSSIILPNAGAGGQGTFYYSAYFQRYIWLGQASISNSATFYMTTAPAPEGPWEVPYELWQGEDGDNAIAGGYSLQAHPGLGGDAQGGVYVTWSQQWSERTDAAGYTTPLVWLQF